MRLGRAGFGATNDGMVSGLYLNTWLRKVLTAGTSGLIRTTPVMLERYQTRR